MVFARWPAPSRCKRRLMAAVGPQRAAAVQRGLLSHVLQVCRLAVAHSRRQGTGLPLQLVLAVSGLGPRAARRWGAALGLSSVTTQGPGGLGVRLRRQLLRGLRQGGGPVLLIGSDLPQLAVGDLLQALALLREHPLVLGPAVDGGYWLIGLRGDWPTLFAGRQEAIAWGSDQVLRQTLAVARELDLEPALLPLRADLDRPADLRGWR